MLICSPQIYNTGHRFCFKRLLIKDTSSELIHWLCFPLFLRHGEEDEEMLT
jgi:hypothetical protein